MKKQKVRKGQKNGIVMIWLIMCLGFFMFSPGVGLSQGNDLEPLPWGIGLEELNQVFKEKYKNGEIREDRDRPEIELQFSPNGFIRFTGGKLKALFSSTDGSSRGHLFGYSYDGKFFGKVLLFRDNPLLFPETVIKILRGKFPEGRVFQSFASSKPDTVFEYKSDQMYVFSMNKGVFYYDPTVLNRIIKIQQAEYDKDSKKFEKSVQERSMLGPP